ncbi:nickel pincer cofactor biosynthesis protein LarC [Pseudonocardia sp. ICBG1293]|uniref:nickel pincer cofactor biosynthesis protein LarC n=1 Tax=Pseudonocardia sp. ICBG1293 TaxID=2844382 RepID=UPI001CCF5B2C|nr:nickel pincer cofactor biosynthesis protein LarC [Pseudonocardia sp. ICBG1293]
MNARTAWIDAGAGVAGDMLLGALLDAGADPEVVRHRITSILPGEVAVDIGPTRRAGLRATRALVRSTAEDHPHRAWADIRDLLAHGPLPPEVRDPALRVFGLLAEAEARVHDVPADRVHFHEVGSWDSIADVVGVCAAVADLALTALVSGPVALGSGRVRTAHGDLPVPVPAVLELAVGRPVVAGGEGELTTPTGMALLRGLTEQAGPLPAMTVEATGYGAGARDVQGRANVVRVVLGSPADRPAPAAGELVVLETNVDDMDPRVWPGVLQGLLDRGAADAWLTPILMKKGRPAHTLHVLTAPEGVAVLQAHVLRATSTLGVRRTVVSRHALDRTWTRVTVESAPVRIKMGVDDGLIMHAAPEYEDVAALAVDRDLPARQVLESAVAAAEAAGLRPGAPVPRD